MKANLQEFLKVAEEAAIAGGRVLLQHRYEPLEIEHKDQHEVVTNVDKLADQAICHLLNHHFPEHAIVSEESGSRHTASAYSWIIDPLDGTESYIRGQNFAGVTLALTREGQTIVGVVCHPFHDELYTAVVNGPTCVNGNPIHVTQATTLKHARMIIDYSPRDALRQHLYNTEWQRGFKQVFRIGGSVALNMCLVARGAAEGYLYGRIRNRVKSWDIAAAALIVRGAGGRVLDRHCLPLDTNHPQGFMLCCNSCLDVRSLLNSDSTASPDT